MLRPDPISAEPARAKKRALLLYGGWQEHVPAEMASFAADRFLYDFDVIRSQSLAMLNNEALSSFDLLVPIWTFGELSAAEHAALFRAVGEGLGVVAWHGFASAFLASREHKHLLGGQFVAHPGGSSVTYDVHFHDNDPLVTGISDFAVTSEQYYMLIDPAVKVIASTAIRGSEMPWLAGVRMPVAWTRSWNEGRIFYCSLGHSVDVLAHPSVAALLRRAAHWASKSIMPGGSLRSR
jgi:type 1 glutamine amidotransferase